MILYVKTTPNARKSEVVGWEEDPIRGRILRIRIAAPPVEGKANSELRSFLADITVGGKLAEVDDRHFHVQIDPVQQRA